jgi:hypothetical protein
MRLVLVQAGLDAFCTTHACMHRCAYILYIHIEYCSTKTLFAFHLTFVLPPYSNRSRFHNKNPITVSVRSVLSKSYEYSMPRRVSKATLPSLLHQDRERERERERERDSNSSRIRNAESSNHSPQGRKFLETPLTVRLRLRASACQSRIRRVSVPDRRLSSSQSSS